MRVRRRQLARLPLFRQHRVRRATACRPLPRPASLEFSPARPAMAPPTTPGGKRPRQIVPGPKTITPKPAKSTTGSVPSISNPGSGPRSPSPARRTTAKTPTKPTAKTPTKPTATPTPVPKTVPAKTTGVSTSPAAPNGLGQVSTDLGRWRPRSAYGTWAFVAGTALAAVGGGIVGARRRRRSVTLSHRGQNNAR